MSVPLQTLPNNAQGGGQIGSSTGATQSSQTQVNTSAGSQTQNTGFQGNQAANATVPASNVSTTPSGRKSPIAWLKGLSTCEIITGIFAVIGIPTFGLMIYWSQRQDEYGSTQTALAKTQTDLAKKADRIQTWKDCRDESLNLMNSTICDSYRGLSYDDVVNGNIPSLTKRALLYTGQATYWIVRRLQKEFMTRCHEIVATGNLEIWTLVAMIGGGFFLAMTVLDPHQAARWESEFYRQPNIDTASRTRMRMQPMTRPTSVGHWMFATMNGHYRGTLLGFATVTCLLTVYYPGAYVISWYLNIRKP
ncbi:uncharacterized protein BDZ99DRAFT_522167 [Mytilinidion resinicola]|uniref:Uncharacterized protein n=1 Tax=Mytilinidion resinicola TaxID=574789 RepID=A0A6A6YL92_9PEZI|nr:uncharacterized protein BDZ99DRAFT_522167 [Mytilinidion resinicola]KAF2808637.1 hypothetical protein BDZ99DRAFT_522167 [Mytilinidion resinicola]